MHRNNLYNLLVMGLLAMAYANPLVADDTSYAAELARFRQYRADLEPDSEFDPRGVKITERGHRLLQLLNERKCDLGTRLRFALPYNLRGQVITESSFSRNARDLKLEGLIVIESLGIAAPNALGITPAGETFVAAYPTFADWQKNQFEFKPPPIDPKPSVPDWRTSEEANDLVRATAALPIPPGGIGPQFSDWPTGQEYEMMVHLKADSVTRVIEVAEKLVTKNGDSVRRSQVLLGLRKVEAKGFVASASAPISARRQVTFFCLTPFGAQFMAKFRCIEELRRNRPPMPGWLPKIRRTSEE
jgi:hypothetical protein